MIVHELIESIVPVLEHLVEPHYRLRHIDEAYVEVLCMYLQIFMSRDVSSGCLASYLECHFTLGFTGQWVIVQGFGIQAKPLYWR